MLHEMLLLLLQRTFGDSCNQWILMWIKFMIPHLSFLRRKEFRRNIFSFLQTLQKFSVEFLCVFEQLFQDESLSLVKLFPVHKSIFSSRFELNEKTRLNRGSFLPVMVVEIGSNVDDLSENLYCQILLQ